MRRVVLWVVLVLVVGFGVAFAVPAIRYPLLALLRNEHLYEGRPLGYWLAALKDGDPTTRSLAATNLGDAQVDRKDSPDRAQYPAVVTGLVEALGDPDGYVRKCAGRSLLLYPRESAVPGDSATVARLLKTLGDKETVVRKAAIRSLWQIGPAAKDGDGVARLTEALGDKDDFVREYAARTLGKIGPEAAPAVPALIELLRTDEWRDAREHAAKSLGSIGARAIGSHLPQAVKTLLAGLKDEVGDVRRDSARSLGQLGATEAVPALRPLLKDHEERVRTAAAEALQRLEPPGAQKGR